MANNPNVNKVVLGSETLLDLSDDTATAEDVVSGKTFHLKSGAKATGTASYAGSPVAGGNADISNGILYGTVDSTSTATVFTATVDGLTSLYDGVTVVLHNGVVTSAAGFTINVNGLGAKKCYNNLTNATQDTTIFNIAYTMMFIYSEALDNGNGGWWCYRGYDGNTNTIGYQVRTNSGNLVAADTGYRYRLWLTSADGSKWVPINTSTSTNSTTARTLNTRPIDPFGPIVYRATNGTCTEGTGIGATGIWQQYTLTIGYSYMASRFALTFPDSVFLRCTPQSDGSAVMNDIVQALPSTKDGKIYIHLGTAYSATSMELQIEHPVYWHDGTGIRLWTGAEPSAGGSTVEVTQTLTSGTAIASIDIDGDSTTLYAPTPPTVPGASSTTPSMDGTAAVGTSTTYARADHVHPTDTSLVPKSATNGNKETTIANNGNRLMLAFEEGDSYSDVILGRNTGPSIYATDGTNSATVDVLPTGVSIDKLAAPFTSTMPTTKQYVDNGLAAKQDSLVSGTSIKTVNSTSLLGSGDISVQPTLVSGTNIKTVNSTSLLGSGDISVQPTLVSGTNIKTVGGTSLLGSGDIPITITMEDTDVDAAVEEAWPMPGYPIIDYNGYGRSITLDGTYGSDVTVLETEALAGSVVTISSGAGILIVADANGDEVSTTQVDTYSIGGSSPYEPPEYVVVFSFTMPESEVTLSL